MREWAKQNPVGSAAGGVPLTGQNAVAVKTLQCPVCRNLCQPPANVPAITCPTCHNVVALPPDFYSVSVGAQQLQPQPQQQPLQPPQQSAVVVVQPVHNSTAPLDDPKNWDAQKQAAYGGATATPGVSLPR